MRTPELSLHVRVEKKHATKVSHKPFFFLFFFNFFFVKKWLYMAFLLVTQPRIICGRKV